MSDMESFLSSKTNECMDSLNWLTINTANISFKPNTKTNPSTNPNPNPYPN